MDANALSEQLERFADSANAMVAEARIQFDTLVTLQNDERKDMRDAFHREKERMRKHYGRIIAGLIIAMILLLGGIIGGAVYVLSNFDFVGYSQEAYIGGNGTNNIYDGVHIDRWNAE